MSANPAEAEYIENVDGGPDLIEPIPVIVDGAIRVQEFPPRMVATDQLPVAALPTRLVNEHRSRATVTLAAYGADVWIGGDQVTPGTGFLIPAGGSLSIEATSALFGVALVPGTAIVHVLTQHRDG